MGFVTGYLIRYENFVVYAGGMLLIEIWWECEMFANLRYLLFFHEQRAAWGILVGHWLYWLSGILQLVHGLLNQPPGNMPMASADPTITYEQMPLQTMAMATSRASTDTTPILESTANSSAEQESTNFNRHGTIRRFYRTSRLSNASGEASNASAVRREGSTAKLARQSSQSSDTGSPGGARAPMPRSVSEIPAFDNHNGSAARLMARQSSEESIASGTRGSLARLPSVSADAPADEGHAGVPLTSAAAVVAASSEI